MTLRSPPAAVILGGLLAVVAHYAATLAGVGGWQAELAYFFVPGAALGLALKRALRGAGRTAGFWGLLAAGAGIWILAEGLWTAALLAGGNPYLRSHPLHDALFIGFLVPMIGAVALAPHPRRGRADRVALADVGLVAVAIVFVFARLVLLPRQTPLPVRAALLASLCLALALWAATLWRLVEDRAWKRTYALLALFGVVYGGLSAAANGYGRTVLPGSVLDLAWIVPFVLLAGAAVAEPAGLSRKPSGWLVVLLCGPGPLVLDLVFDALLPETVGSGHAAHVRLLLPVSALMAAGCALRLRLQESAEERERAETDARAEEEQRAGRLGALAAVSATIIEELQLAVADVVARARAVAESMGDKAERVIGQAERAERIVKDLARALALVRPGTRRDLEIGAVVEDTLRSAMGRGLGLRVRLEGLGDLPRVSAEQGALRAAVLHLARNAAQASPGGLLRVSGESRGSEVVLRFRDDGPGVPEEIRTRIFDPFFTTRRVGEGVGLGLTLVHFVARRHGGSILLETGEGGGCFALRLPAAADRPTEPGSERWPLAAAVFASAAVATLLAVLPDTPGRSLASGAFQFLAAAVAAGGLAWAARLRQGRERVFWALLAAAPAVWAAVRLFRLYRGVADGPLASQGGWPFVLYALADLAWASALLLRPDRRQDGNRVPLLGAGAALALFAYVYVYLAALPAAFATLDPALSAAVVLARGGQRLALVLWAAALSFRARSPYWQGVYTRLALVLGAWVVGHTLSGYALNRPGHHAGSVADLGWIVPFLLLAALGAHEALRGVGRESAPTWTPYPLRSAAAMVALAAVPAFDLLFGGPSGHPELDVARAHVTRATILVVGLLLAVREVLAHRDAATTRILLKGAHTQLRSAERRSRLLGLVGSAVHEISGHLSGIRTLVRLLLTHPQLPDRARLDADRIQANSEAATRAVRNLLTMIRRAPEALTFVPLNDVVRTVVEIRQADLAQEGIRLRAILGREIPAMPLDGPAIEQVLLGLIDNAAVAIRAGGREGTVEVVSAVENERLVLRVRDDGPGLSDAARRRLSGPVFGSGAQWTGPGLGLHVAREVVVQHGGTIVGRNRPQGGAEFEIRIPIHGRSEQITAG